MSLSKLLFLTAIIFTTLTASASTPAKASAPAPSNVDTSGFSLIVKKWVCTDVNDPELDLSKLTKEQMVMVKESFAKIGLDFKKDGTLESTLDTKVEAGNWELNYAHKTLTMISASGVRDECLILKISRTELKLKKDKTTLTFAPAK